MGEERVWEDFESMKLNILNTIFLAIISLFSIGIYLNQNIETNIEQETLSIRTHTIKHYDTMLAITQDYKVSEYTVRSSNKLYSRKLKVGKRLYIPNKNVTLHKISKKDTINRIIKKYYVSPRDLIIFDSDLNNKDDCNYCPLPINGFIAIPQLKKEKFIWPTRKKPYIVSGFGYRHNPFKHSQTEYHLGFDIKARFESILAAKPGRVVYSGWWGGYGRTVVIEHADGFKTVYAHLRNMKVRRGAYVRQYYKIGISGNTGRSTGPHLHFEIIKNNEHVNPYRHIWPIKEMNKE